MRSARHLTDEQRSALAAYFSVYKGQEEGLAKMYLTSPDHPTIARAYAHLDAAWREVRPIKALLWPLFASAALLCVPEQSGLCALPISKLHRR